MPSHAKPARSASSPAWHVPAAGEIAELLGSRESGLSHDEARGRLAQYGPNRFESDIATSPLTLLLRQIRSPLVLVLIVAGAITLAIGETADAVVILLVVALNTMIGFAQERQAERSVSALFKLIAPVSRVIRSNREQEIASADLVPGDLVLLDSGMRVPADLRLIHTNALDIDESTLTGESVPVTKRLDALPENLAIADRANIAFAGTTVSRGRGSGFVVATAARTELGVIAGQMRSLDHNKTPLQERMDQLARIVGVIVLACSLAAFAIGIASGHTVSEMFLVAVALAVSAVPEGLPIAFTIALALGVRKMSHRQAIVRQLASVETLGSTTVIGSDKTGTLTENLMTVRRLWSAGSVVIPGEDDDPAPLGQRHPLAQTLLAGVLTNEATVSATEDGPVATGDPTEAALLSIAVEFGIEPDEMRADWRVLADLPFESDRAFSATVRASDDLRIAFVKGSPERVLAMCDSMIDADGQVIPLDAGLVQEAAHDMASDGLRVLATARSAPLTEHPSLDELDAPHGLVLLGLLGMADPPRSTARAAIATCRAAGVRVLMITGDHAATASAIARELGISDTNTRVITGTELSAMDDQAFAESIATVDIYARVAPEDKLRIVQALKENGEVVAVTGDGVNDAPALRGADIGIAMGKRGTDVAKEAADIVLTDDNFASIVAAVEEGRVTFANVRKVVFYLFSANAAEVLTLLAALALDWPLPLVAVQILWLNLVTDSAQVMALAAEPGEPDIMRQPPLGRAAGILSRWIWQRVAISAVVMAIGTLAVFRWQLDRTDSERAAQTVALTTMVFYQMLQAINARSETRSIFRIRPTTNPYLFGAIVLTVLVHGAVVLIEPVGKYLRTESLDLTAWLASLAVATTILVAVETHKRLSPPVPAR